MESSTQDTHVKKVVMCSVYGLEYSNTCEQNSKNKFYSSSWQKGMITHDLGTQ